MYCSFSSMNMEAGSDRSWRERHCCDGKINVIFRRRLGDFRCVPRRRGSVKLLC